MHDRSSGRGVANRNWNAGRLRPKLLQILLTLLMATLLAPQGLQAAEEASAKVDTVTPLVILGVGIAIVLSLIIVLRINAFIAMITAAIVVSLMAPGEIEGKVGRMAAAFGSTAGSIGIVIALAAVIGKCMLDSGAADRIVRAFVGLLGEKRAPFALMGSGYVLSIPVFFDTVFYLLVPLARSLHRRTGVKYLTYIMAIAAGGALTHSLVPPTPGPLLMASALNVDLGVMILVGGLVAFPAAVAGLFYASITDRIMKTPMRPLGKEPEPKPLSDDELPSLAISLAPVLLPVLMISVNTVLTTVADFEPTARIAAADVNDWPAAEELLAAPSGVGAHLRGMLGAESQAALGAGELSAEGQETVIADLNRLIVGRREVYDEDAFLGVKLSGATKSLMSENQTRQRQAVRERKNRLLLEDALQGALGPHLWLTPWRRAANVSDTLGNANLALLLSTILALWTLARQRGLTRHEIAEVVEVSLMSGGVIILITSSGGAFGGMLQAAGIGDAIRELFQTDGASGGSMVLYLSLGFLVAAVLKVAQGSGTVSMIVGSNIMAAIVVPGELGCHPVYLATAIGSGSLVGSWMNDSGFWIFAKMGGLTETEALKSWTLLLVFIGLVSFGITLLLAFTMPLL